MVPSRESHLTLVPDFYLSTTSRLIFFVCYKSLRLLDGVLLKSISTVPRE